MSNKSKSAPAGKLQTQLPRLENPSKLTKVRLLLFFSFPFALYFSYHPLLPLFSSASTNYELSLPLLWLAVFTVLSLPDFCFQLKSFFSSKDKTHSRTRVLPLLLFPVYLCLSVLWSPNPLRAFLTAGIFSCLLVSACSLYWLGRSVLISSFPCLLSRLPLFSSTFSPRVSGRILLRRLFLGSAVLVSLVCWVQSLLDVLGVPRDSTLLCLGCTSRIFGFPHPSGFAIEPQFMGNLLLAPTLYSFYLLLTSSDQKSHSPRPLGLALLSSFLLTTLFLVFSRGALYSFLLAFVLLLILELKTNRPRHVFLTVLLVPLSLCLCLGSQAIFAQLSQASRTTPACAISTSLAQLSLNSINLDCNSTKNSPPPSSNPDQNPASALDLAELSPSSPVFSGYVAESTEIRLHLSRLALASALKSPARLLFGTGLGSAGTTLFRDGAIASPKEIIQNEYLSLLLETGILGLLFLFISLCSLLSFLRSRALLTLANLPLFSALALAFACSLLFFSGLPNALHLYLFPVYLLLLEAPASKL